MIKKLYKNYFERGTIFIKMDVDELKEISVNPFNRDINNNHLTEIMKGMLTDLKNFPAIIVNASNSHLMDGQHRVVALQKLVNSGLLPKDSTLNVQLVSMSEKEEIETIVNLNNKSKTWSTDDFIKSNIKQGNENYKLLDDFCKEGSPLLRNRNKSRYTYAVAAIHPESSSISNNLKDGKLIVSGEDIDKARKRVKQVEELNKVIKQPLKGQWIREFLKAWSIISEKYPHTMTEWKTELKKKQYWVDKPTNRTQFEKMLRLAHVSIEEKKSQVA